MVAIQSAVTYKWQAKVEQRENSLHVEGLSDVLRALNGRDIQITIATLIPTQSTALPPRVQNQDKTAPPAREGTPEAARGKPADVLTDRQLQKIYALGRARYSNEETTNERCKEVTGKEPEYLTKSQANAFIKFMEEAR